MSEVRGIVVLKLLLPDTLSEKLEKVVTVDFKKHIAEKVPGSVDPRFAAGLPLLRALKSWNSKKEIHLSGVIRAKRIDSHDSRESGDSRESEIGVIHANRPDAL